MKEEERRRELPDGNSLRVIRPDTTDPCLLLWDRGDADWTSQLEGHFAVALLSAPEERLKEGIEQAKAALEEAGILTVALVAVGADSAPLRALVQDNPLGFTALVLVAPDTLEPDLYTIPVMVIADHETAGAELQDAFDAIVAPEKALFAIKGGGARPMDTKPPIFLIALRQAVFRAITARKDAEMNP